jgi:hypothetical protein
MALLCLVLFSCSSVAGADAIYVCSISCFHVMVVFGSYAFGALFFVGAFLAVGAEDGLLLVWVLVLLVPTFC